MRSAVRGVLVGALVLAVFGAIGARSGWLAADVPRPSGTGPWMVARATGLLAYVALGLDVVAGLLVSTRAGDRVLPRGQLVDLHGWLSPLALGLVLAHAVVLLADRYVRFDVLDLLVPFASRRWPLAIGAGVIGGYLLLVVHLSFGMRKRLGPTTWRRLHYLSFVAFALVTAHAFAVGTDRGNAWYAAIYAIILAVVAALVAARVRRLHSTHFAQHDRRRGG